MSQEKLVGFQKGSAQSEFVHNMWKDETLKERMKKGLKAAWADPDKRKTRLVMTQSDSAKKKRNISLDNWRQKHPDIFAQSLEIAHSASKKAKEIRLQVCLGDNPKQTLNELTKEQGLSTREIADRFGKSKSFISGLLIKYDEKPTYISSLPREEVNRRQGIYYWADTFGLVQNLSGKYPEIMTRLYSIGRQRVVMKDVGREFGGKTREGIRQIEEKCLNVLERKIDSMWILY